MCASLVSNGRRDREKKKSRLVISHQASNVVTKEPQEILKI